MIQKAFMRMVWQLTPPLQTAGRHAMSYVSVQATADLHMDSSRSFRAIRRAITGIFNTAQIWASPDFHHHSGRRSPDHDISGDTQQSRCRHILAMLGLIFCVACDGNPLPIQTEIEPLPYKWRLPTDLEMQDGTTCGIALGANASVSADFNDDGIDDTAVIAMRDAGPEVGVLVHLSQPQDMTSWVIVDRTKTSCIGIGLRIVPAGRIDGTRCRGIADPCRKSEAGPFLTTRPSLLIMQYASSGVVLVWNEDTNTFDRIFDSSS
jgi:hypothetical protein